jgi:hypothetical protein
MKRYRALLMAVVLLVGTAVVGYYLYRAERTRQSTLSEGETRKLDPTASALSEAGGKSRSVELFLYKSAALDSEERFLLTETSEIVETEDLALNAYQIVSETISNGSGFPTGLQLRRLYVLEDGTAVVDLSEATAQEQKGGVASEFGLIMSVTRSLRGNLESIQRVQFLVEGESRATLAGHVSIQEPFM